MINPRICMTHHFALMLLALSCNPIYSATADTAPSPKRQKLEPEKERDEKTSMNLLRPMQSLTLDPNPPAKRQKLDTEKEQKGEREKDKKTSMAALSPMQTLPFMSTTDNSYQYIANDAFNSHVVGSDSNDDGELPLVLNFTVYTEPPTSIIHCPEHWQPEIIISHLKDLYRIKRGDTPDSSLYVLDRRYPDDSLLYCKLAPRITTDTLALFSTLGNGEIEQAFPNTPNIKVAEKNSSIVLAPGTTLNNLCRLWTNLYIYLKSLPVPTDNLPLKDLGVSHQRKQLKEVVNGYEKHQKVIEGTARDNVGFIRLLFFEGGTSTECVEYTKKRASERYPVHLLADTLNLNEMNIGGPMCLKPLDF
jgi:hypothetical protein